MDETDLHCIACGGKLWRRSMSISSNVRRRQVDSKRDKYICGSCQETYPAEVIEQMIDPIDVKELARW